MTPPTFRQHLVLLGAERAQLHLLRALAQQRPANLAITLIAPQQRYWPVDCVPGWATGRLTDTSGSIDLSHWVQACGARHLESPCTGIDAHHRAVTLADGQTLTWDWLAINPGPVMDRAQTEQLLPGAREHALFLHPLERFVALWPQLVATLGSGPAHWAVVGNSLQAMELAMAAAHVLRAQPGSHVTLIAHPTSPPPALPARAQHLLETALREHKITRIQAPCAGFAAGEVLLDMGGRVQCKAAVLVDGGHPPAWIARSGLDLNDAGAIAVQATHQSTGHPHVFVAGEACAHADQHPTGNGGWAPKIEASFAANVHAAVNNLPLRDPSPSAHAVRFIDCSQDQAIVSWGEWAAKGRWVTWWLDRINRRFVANYTP
jgi:NADH dehydrogenase FAD-containing subunit